MHIRDTHTPLHIYMMCMCSCVFLEFNFSFDLGRQENSSSSFASWSKMRYMVCILSHMRPTLYFACESKPASHPRSHYFFACAPPTTKTPPPSARSSFSLALCADDKMCPRGFETFSLRERELEKAAAAASLLQNAINATTKVLRAAPPLTISNVAPCETFN